MFAFLFLLLTAGGPSPSVAAPVNIAAGAERALRQDAQALADAAVRDDFATVVKLTYTGLVRALGGEKEAMRIMKEQTAKMRAQGSSIVESTVTKLRACFADRGKFQCVLEGSQTVAIPGGAMRVETEVIGFSGDQGKSWTFLGSGQDPEALRKRFPEILGTLPLRRVPPPQPVERPLILK